jgi:hypothetical protein
MRRISVRDQAGSRGLEMWSARRTRREITRAGRGRLLDAQAAEEGYPSSSEAGEYVADPEAVQGPSRGRMHPRGVNRNTMPETQECKVWIAGKYLYKFRLAQKQTNA